jgi:Flavin containing amine oxidoreductase
MGGLAAAIDLGRSGHRVTVLERAASPGGKLRALEVDGVAIDAGPTVFTMRWVFESLLADAGLRSIRRACLLAMRGNPTPCSICTPTSNARWRRFENFLAPKTPLVTVIFVDAAPICTTRYARRS